MFTQAELETAYKQMQDERKQDAKKAQEALKWVKQQLNMNRCSAHIKGHSDFGVSCYPTPYILFFVHETYGPYLDSYTKILDTMPWAKKVKGKPGFNKHNPAYEVTTPQGEYPLMFEYFDNHCTGY